MKIAKKKKMKVKWFAKMDMKYFTILYCLGKIDQKYIFCIIYIYGDKISSFGWAQISTHVSQNGLLFIVHQYYI